MTFTHALATNNYGPAKFIVDASAANGTHTTIAAALTSASSGDTIFIRPGTYTEDITLKAGVNLTSFNSEYLAQKTSTSSNVIILGNATASFTGMCTINGIELKTNSNFFLTVSGSNATLVNIHNCFLNCSNNTGISYTSSNASSFIQFYSCLGNLGTTGIALYSMSSTGEIDFNFCTFADGGNSTTAASNSAGTVSFNFSSLPFPISTSSTGQVNGEFCTLGYAPLNATGLTTAGTGAGNYFYHTRFEGGTASAVSVGSGTTLALYSCTLNSSNTNAITGAGTLNETPLAFSGTSSGNNVTTVSDLGFGRVGTFTSAIAFGGGTTGITYSQQSGKYTRIGNIVFFHVAIVLTNKGSSTGTLTVTGFPFTSANDGLHNVSACETNATLPASTTYFTFQMNPGTTNGNITGDVAHTNIADTNCANNSFFVVTGFYFTS